MKDTKISKESLDRLVNVMDTWMTYKDDFQAGQQFFDFMWEDKTFIDAYQMYLDGYKTND